MERLMRPDPALFAETAIAPQTHAMNADIVAKMSALPDPWAFPPEVIRQARRAGHGPFPLPPLCRHAEVIQISGPGRDIPLRIIRPQHRAATGAYLHLHGGGWTFGGSDMQDPRLERIAENTGLIAVSVEYRLAPEHPYPCGPDDCEAAAVWLEGEGRRWLGIERLFIGGESAGGHLALVTLLRMRDRHGRQPFLGGNLVAGCFDLGLTPSARAWGDLRLVMTTRDIRKFVESFLPAGQDTGAPDVSPLYAELAGLPALHLSVGTRDALLDDTLFLASRLMAAGGEHEVSIHPGGAHAFEAFDFPLTEDSLKRMDAFLRQRLDQRVNS